MKIFKYCAFLILLALPFVAAGQDVELFAQFNGRYDYVAFGNTLNTAENTGQTPPSPCVILTESSADFALDPDQTIIAAFLYWAGVGEGDLEVTLNGNPIVAERTFTEELQADFPYFAAYADVTSLVTLIGNDTYLLSDLDLTDVIEPYCGNTTNFGGWAISVVYEDNDLALNQVNIFDGLRGVSAVNQELTIVLDNLNVLDNVGAKIGFTSWEGDASLNITETLQINGNIISNPPLNPEDNAFNSTNSFTGAADLYNMDLDFYNIENNINPGDTSATITLTSGQDFVMINNVITVLNTELPDATIEIDNVEGGDECGNRDIEVDYTVYNVNSTDVLPPNTPIAFYANTTLIGQAATVMELPIGGSESGSISLTIPVGIPADFVLKAFVDDDGSGNGTVNETNEQNNGFLIDVHLMLFPEIIGLMDLELCDVVGLELFNLTFATAQIDPENIITYHLTEDDAINNVNAIPNPEAYENISNPQTIFIRVDNTDCFVTDSFEIEVIVCPLPDGTITIDDDLNACRKRDLTVPYTVFNLEGTGPLPAATPIAFYVEGSFVGLSVTQDVIPIGGNEPGSVTITIADTVPDTFVLTGVVDDNGTGNGIVEELNEFNNTFDITVTFGTIPPLGPLPDLVACDTGFGLGVFDLTDQDENIIRDPGDMVSYFQSFENAEANVNPITDPEMYFNTTDPETIYVRLENEVCFTVGEFFLRTEKCPPDIPQGISPNGDGLNDVFKIEGLLNVFDDFILKIYSRKGNLIYEGGHEEGLWNAIPNTGILYQNKFVPVGTYYYVLLLNDPQFPDPYIGFVYVNY